MGHGIKKLVIPVLTMLLALFSVVSSPFFAETTEFSGGCGTESNPYLISTVEQLNFVRNYPDAHFRLTCDLVFSGSNQNWIPINTFSGVFDGQGYSIRNLAVFSSGISQEDLYGGLFEINNGVIQNLNLVDCAVSVVKKAMGSSDLLSYSGGIVGYNLGTVSNCTVSGIVSAGRQGRAGGIVGANEGTIRSCSNSATVATTGPSGYSGGICGSGGNVSYCFNSGSVSSDNLYAGGISGAGENISFCYNVGSVQSDYATGGITGKGGNIANCYNDGSVGQVDASTSESVQYRSYTGGIIGEANGVVEDCYNSGTVSVSANSTSHSSGGIVGWNTVSVQCCYNVGVVSGSRSGAITGLNEGMLLNCYYLDNLRLGVGYGPDAAVRCTVGQMSRGDTYYGFDFSTEWHLDPLYRYAYPQLKNVLLATVVSLEVKSQPDNNNVVFGGEVDLTGAAVLITYSDGHTTVQSITEEMVSPLSSDQPGFQHLTVSYGGVTAAQALTFYVGCEVHEYGSWITTEETTCVNSGSREKICRHCGYTENETVLALGHSYGDWTVTKPATCSSSGIRMQVCTRCFDQKRESLAMLKHSLFPSVITRYPTCTEPGIETGKCVNCNMQKSEQISATGHTYTSGKMTMPTCTVAGKDVRYCTVCGLDQITEIPALGHFFESIVTVKEPTVTEPGLREYRCARCSESIQEVIPVLSVETDFFDPTSDFSTDINTDISLDSGSTVTDVTVDSDNSDKSVTIPISTTIADMPSDPSDKLISSWVIWGLVAIVVSLGIVIMTLCLYFDKNSDDIPEEDLDDENLEPNPEEDSPFEIFGDE